jgi:putative inorganic carbon (hco3(-)) transporter
VAGLIWRLRSVPRAGAQARSSDAWWAVVVGGPAALALAWAVTVSLQAASAFVLVVAVVALHQRDRRWGIFALFALWFVAPGLRRVLGAVTGYVGHDPLSIAPFAATAAIASVELLRYHAPARIRHVFSCAAIGFAIGLPVGLVAGPPAAVFALVAYLGGLSGGALGLGEPGSLRDSTLRRVLLVALPIVAVYAIVQRVLPLPSWDQAWIDATRINTIGTGQGTEVRVFSSLNSPGTLAALLGLSLIAYLTVQRARAVTLLGGGLVAVALAMTSVRSAWVALIAGGLAHMIASEGRSARRVLGAAAVLVVATLVLSPFSTTARQTRERFNSIAHFRGDPSATERRATFRSTLPLALAAPLGHGLGTAGEPSKLTGDSFLRSPDNGYLSLMYQVGPVGFLLILAAVAVILRAAWDGARARAPGQDLRVMLFAMLAYLLVQAAFGDVFYGSSAVILWLIGCQVLLYDVRRRAAQRVGAP